MSKTDASKEYKIEKSKSGEEVKVYTTLGKGRRTCDSCGRIVAARGPCVCGHEKGVKHQQKKTTEKGVPSKHVGLVLRGVEWVKEYGDQTTIEDFCESLRLDWEVLEEITSVKELNELKQRKKWVSWVEDCGGSEEAIKLINQIGELSVL